MNQVILKGRLVRDVEIKYTQANNAKIASFSIAVQRDYKNQNNEYESDFFNCTAFKNNADFIEKYFSKGQEILLIGKIQNRSWETDDGEKRYATDIIVDKVEFCGSKKENKTETENNSNNSSDDNLPF